MSILYIILGLLSVAGAAWFKISRRLKAADRAVEASKTNEAKAEVKAEVAAGEAEVARAERDAATAAVEAVHHATEATVEVHREAVAAEDHPDRAAARAAAALRARRTGDIVSGELPRRGPGSGDGP